MTAPAGTFVGSQFVGQAKEPDQAERRADLSLLDVHGRPYHVIYDTMARGVVRIQEQFLAPWLPNMRYIGTKKAGAGSGGFPISVDIEYGKCREDTLLSWDRWFNDLRLFANRMPGVDAVAAVEAARTGDWNNVPAALMMEAGITPEPVEYVEAAMAGNRWVLGFSQTVPAWAHPLIELRELQKKRSEKPLSDDMLDKYRDADEDASAPPPDVPVITKGTGKRQTVKFN